MTLTFVFTYNKLYNCIYIWSLCSFAWFTMTTGFQRLVSWQSVQNVKLATHASVLTTHWTKCNDSYAEGGHAGAFHLKRFFRTDSLLEKLERVFCELITIIIYTALLFKQPHTPCLHSSWESSFTPRAKIITITNMDKYFQCYMQDGIWYFNNDMFIARLIFEFITKIKAAVSVMLRPH